MKLKPGIKETPAGGCKAGTMFCCLPRFFTTFFLLQVCCCLSCFKKCLLPVLILIFYCLLPALLLQKNCCLSCKTMACWLFFVACLASPWGLGPEGTRGEGRGGQRGQHEVNMGPKFDFFDFLEPRCNAAPPRTVTLQSRYSRYNCQTSLKSISNLGLQRYSQRYRRYSSPRPQRYRSDTGFT